MDVCCYFWFEDGLLHFVCIHLNKGSYHAVK